MSIFRRRFQLIESRSTLPYDCELEYLTTDANKQYINLGIEFDPTTDAMEIDFQQTLNIAQIRTFFAANGLVDYSNGNKYFALALWNGSKYVYKVIHGNYTLGLVRRKWFVDYVNKRATVDDLSFVNTWTEATLERSGQDATVYMLAEPTNASAPGIVGRIYSAKYWKNGLLVRDLIPVRVRNIGYFYDKVSKELFANEGGGSFGLGHDRLTSLSKYEVLDYIEHYNSHGFIDTRVLVNQDSRIVADIYPCLTSSTVLLVFGTANSSSAAHFGFNVKTGGYLNVYDSYNTSGTSTICLRDLCKRIVIDKTKNSTTIKKGSTTCYSKSFTAATFSPKYYCYLGLRREGHLTSYPAASNNFYKGATYSFKIYNDDSLVLDYVPVKHPDGTYGMYDSVSKHFIESTGAPFKGGYEYFYDDTNKCVFYHYSIDSSTLNFIASDNLMSSLIPVKSREIKIKPDSNYTTTLVEFCGEWPIKVGGQTILSQDSTGTTYQVSPQCTNVAILLSENPIDGYIPDFKVYDVGDTNYLTLTALEDTTFSLTIGSNVKVDYLSYVEYSIDNGLTWTRKNNSTSTVTLTTPIITAGNKVLWRGSGLRTGSNNTLTTSYFSIFSSTGRFNASGNILSLVLLDKFSGCYSSDGITTGDYSFEGLFYNSKIVSASELCLPLTKPAVGPYARMFMNCGLLIAAPKLPSKGISTYMYLLMFLGCTSLVNPPELPATALLVNCYQYMFSGCTSLITAPTLPATTMQLFCYNEMFKNCTSLTTMPVLSSTSLANSCYRAMFSGCTSLVNIHPLPATSTSSSYAYAWMFQDCTSLTTCPTMSLSSIGAGIFNGMFYGCTSLVNASFSIPIVNKETSCSLMFLNCTSLTSPPILPATSLAKNCYAHMFRGCTSLVNPPELPAFSLAETCYLYMFAGCTSLEKTPEMLFLYTASGCCQYMFMGCSLIESILLRKTSTLDTNCYKNMLSGCTSLNTIKVYSHDVTTTSGTSGWVCAVNSDSTLDTENLGVAATGTFIQNIEATWEEGVNGIPTGWTVIYYDIEKDKYYSDAAGTIEIQRTDNDRIKHVEYIGADSFVYYSSGFTASTIDNFEVTFSFETHGGYSYIFGNMWDSNHNVTRVLLHNTNPQILYVNNNTKTGSSTAQTIYTLGEKATIRTDGYDVYKNNEKVGTMASTTGTANTRGICFLNSYNISDSTSTTGERRLYNFKGWKEGELVTDQIPVRIGTKTYFYDKIVKTLRGKWGIGTEIVGPDIT